MAKIIIIILQMLAKNIIKTLKRIAANSNALRIVAFNNHRAFSIIEKNTEHDEDASVADLINQHAVAIEGQSTSAISNAFQAELNELKTFQKLQSFFESNRNHMTITQSLLLLIKLNSIENISSDQKVQAQNIQNELVSKCLANKAALSVDKTGTLLITLAHSKFDSSMISPKDLQELESHILVNMNELISKSDPPQAIASLIKLKHIPEDLIKEVNKMNQLSTFKEDSSFYLLRMLINAGITNQSELYQKLWDRIDQSAFKAHNKRCALIIEFVHKFNQLMPEHQNANIQRMQKYIERYAETLKQGQQQPVHFTLSTMNYIKEFNEAVSNSMADTSLQTDEFYNACTKQLMSQPDAFKPGQLLNLVILFEGQTQFQKQLISKTLESMRQDKIDIRTYNFGQLASFVQQVATHCPKDLHVFAKYVDSAVAQGFFEDKDLDEKFRAFSSIMQTFALYDELSDGAATIKYMLMISDIIQSKHTRRFDPYLIDVIWTLVYKDTTTNQSLRLKGKRSTESNPLIPRLLESLYSYKRDTPLTRAESLKLFQINIWIQTQLAEGKLPQTFEKCIPEQLLASAEDRYSEYDKSMFADVQMDVAKRLLDLRVTFRENQRLNKLYRADIKLEHTNMVIMIFSEDNHHPAFEQQGRFPGHDALKNAWLNKEASDNYEVKFISVESWQEKNYLEKLKLLSKITQYQQRQNL